ncbi:hypothetical protein [Ferrigenium sp. UT5]|uniref:hypothetical protein n=1 Tax=Ferrigenium sp. UT5 TaxID=3242105 RepID=UPI003551304D
MQKFDFSIRTRDGQHIVSVVIGANDQAEAERKLRQMYHHCEVLSCGMRESGAAQHAVSMEEIITLISK